MCWLETPHANELWETGQQEYLVGKAAGDLCVMDHVMEKGRARPGG